MSADPAPVVEEGTRAPSEREKKKVERLDDNYIPVEKPGFTVPEGGGIPLGEIDVIAWYINEVPGKHDLLKALHRLFFGSEGPKMKRKLQLRQFKGFPAGSAEKVSEKLKKYPWTVPCLRDLCKFFDLDQSGDKDSLVARATAFIMKPEATGASTVEGLEAARRPTKKRKASPPPVKKASSKKQKKTPKKAAKKEKKEKKAAKKEKPPSPKPARKARAPVVHFALEQKALLKAQFPDLDKRGLSGKVMEKWGNMTEDERKPWVQKHEEEKKKIEEEDALMDLF
jgi:hypothetical protein